MTGPKLVGLGLILLFGLPSLIAASDQRRLPDIFHIALACAALVWAWTTAGIHGFVFALVSGIIVLSIAAIAVALTQKKWGRRFLTGGELKLMTAAAMWLPPYFAIATMIVALLGIVLWMSKSRLAGQPNSRPNLAPFVITTLLAAFALA